MDSGNLVSRRHFLGASGVTFAALGLSPRLSHAEAVLPEASASKLPRWRGFNLLEKFVVGQNARFVENDFAWMRELGFNFVRLPMDYRCWIDGADWMKFREETFKEIDEAVGFGEKHGVHVCLNFHRAPGYTVASPKEEKEIWTDDETLRVCVAHWERFAERYKGIPNARLSFNLFNEPSIVPADAYRRVVEAVLGGIRKHDAERLVICDGRLWGRVPPTELLGLGVAAATRGYEPMKLTHYKAPWVTDADKYPLPSWPLGEGDSVWNKERLRASVVAPWKEFEAKGVGVMVGEFGSFNQTPHDVVLSWMRDFLDLWKEAGWGWAMWNFRGPFGIIDNERADANYGDFHGSKLDKDMLGLLKQASA
jgi:endoglucanase